MRTTHFRPARPAYAARDADVLPVEAQVTMPMPRSFAFVIPAVMPLSLNEPVGFMPSNLIHRLFRPRCSARFRHAMSGVPPSFLENIVVSGPNGSNSRYFHTESGRALHSFPESLRWADGMSTAISSRLPHEEHA